MKPVDVCELPVCRVETKYSPPVLSSWLPAPLRPSRYGPSAVAWRLWRPSGSFESKYGALYSRLAGTPDVVPRVRMGESRTLVDVPPLLPTCQYFCEYCALANARPPITPRQVATPRRLLVSGVVNARGSMLLGCDTASW